MESTVWQIDIWKMITAKAELEEIVDRMEQNEKKSVRRKLIFLNV